MTPLLREIEPCEKKSGPRSQGNCKVIEARRGGQISTVCIVDMGVETGESRGEIAGSDGQVDSAEEASSTGCHKRRDEEKKLVKTTDRQKRMFSEPGILLSREAQRLQLSHTDLEVGKGSRPVLVCSQKAEEEDGFGANLDSAGATPENPKIFKLSQESELHPRRCEFVLKWDASLSSSYFVALFSKEEAATYLLVMDPTLTNASAIAAPDCPARHLVPDPARLLNTTSAPRSILPRGLLLAPAPPTRTGFKAPVSSVSRTSSHRYQCGDTTHGLVARKQYDCPSAGQSIATVGRTEGALRVYGGVRQLRDGARAGAYGLSLRAPLHRPHAGMETRWSGVVGGGSIGVGSLEFTVVRRGAERWRERAGYAYTARHPTASRPARARIVLASSIPTRGALAHRVVYRERLAYVSILPDGRGRGSPAPSASAMSYDAPVFVVRIEWRLGRGSGDSLCPPNCLSLAGADAPPSSGNAKLAADGCRGCKSRKVTGSAANWRSLGDCQS
ncbi:hypothetical protein C8F04DRAFT_1191665 [Mycena alexandri]|uniref:Uncharacterized protein n=1 Tax=Mycena alexandri TaxID=1745969 RepID=A0AAD6SCV3_9AGAR|nr:hypothetical protein C8F04DRAFT_1191665 [Mycena alexandri]